MVAFGGDGDSHSLTDPSLSDIDVPLYLQSDSTAFASNDVCHSKGLDALLSLHVDEKLFLFVDGGVRIFIFEGFPRKQWVGLDVVLLNHMGVSMAVGNFQTRHPMNVLTPTPLGNMMWGFLFERLGPCRGALELEMATSTSSQQWNKPWNHARRHSQVQTTLLASTLPHKGV